MFGVHNKPSRLGQYTMALPGEVGKSYMTARQFSWLPFIAGQGLVILLRYQRVGQVMSRKKFRAEFQVASFPGLHLFSIFGLIFVDNYTRKRKCGEPYLDPDVVGVNDSPSHVTSGQWYLDVSDSRSLMPRC